VLHPPAFRREPKWAWVLTRNFINAKNTQVCDFYFKHDLSFAFGVMALCFGFWIAKYFWLKAPISLLALLVFSFYIDNKTYWTCLGLTGESPGQAMD